MEKPRIPPGPLFYLGTCPEGGRLRSGDGTSFADSWPPDLPLKIGGGHLVDTRRPGHPWVYRLSSRRDATTRDSGLGLSTRLHCTHIIVPLPRDPPNREPSRERGEQAVRPPQVQVERHLEPSPIRLREQPVRVVLCA